MTLPIIDHSVLLGISGGDSSFEQELLCLFVTDTDQHLVNLQELLNSRSDLPASQLLDQIREEAHHIKGASSNVGARAMVASAALVEQQARLGQVDQLPTSVVDLDEAFTAFKQVVKLKR